MTLFTNLSTVLDSVHRHLGYEDLCIKFLSPGEDVDLDHITGGDCKGMVYVRLVTAFQSATFPVASEASTCDLPLAFECEVGVARPFPFSTGLDGKPILPTAVEYAEKAKVQYADMLAMRDAVKGLDVEESQLGTYTPFGPDGYTYGGIWSFWLGED